MPRPLSRPLRTAAGHYSLCWVGSGGRRTSCARISRHTAPVGSLSAPVLHTSDRMGSLGPRPRPRRLVARACPRAPNWAGIARGGAPCLTSIGIDGWRQLELWGPSSGLGSLPGSVDSVLIRVHSHGPRQVRPSLVPMRPGFSPWRPEPDSWESGVPESPHDGPRDPRPPPSSSGL